MLEIIKLTVNNKNEDIIARLYQESVRLHAVYSTQLWKPFLKSIIKLIESNQRRALKLSNVYKKYTYGERLVKSGLISLEKKRVRGDMIEMFKTC